MKAIIIEIKARCHNPEEIELILLNNNARYEGSDRQIDTYFNSDSGQVKLREGNIENSLIYYQRKERKGQKKSEVTLYKTTGESNALKDILANTMGIKIVVDKTRKIFFIENVKFHIDLVKGLGSFVEIEAIDISGKMGEEELRKQCDDFIRLLGLKDAEFLDQSYSDMISLK
ncbi:MAG: class IV adenylate cyclase [Bacteroidota bacterium]|nr:class IV adenylate cyclase [Bacteroidota bacterium]